MRKPEIFVVDDDSDQAELLGQALASRAWTVRVFADPLRALAVLNSDGADLLIADLSMPWMDGWDMIASARLRHPHLKVIMISGYPRADEIASLHHVAFFAKPIDLDALRKAIDTQLHESDRVTQ